MLTKPIRTIEQLMKTIEFRMTIVGEHMKTIGKPFWKPLKSLRTSLQDTQGPHRTTNGNHTK